MSDGHPEFGQWLHVVALGGSTSSALTSLFVVLLYHRFFPIVHNTLNGLLVAASFGSMLLCSFRLSVLASVATGHELNDVSCNVVVSTFIAMVTWISGTLAAYYIHLTVVQRRGGNANRRSLRVYLGLVAFSSLLMSGITAYEFATGGTVDHHKKKHSDACVLPGVGEYAFVVPTVFELVMVLAGIVACGQLLCRRQSLSAECKKFIFCRGAYVVILFVLRACVFAYHYKGGSEGKVTPLSVAAAANMIFDSFSGVILFMMFFWMEGGWVLLRRLLRRRVRRYRRRARRARNNQTIAKGFENSAEDARERGDSRYATRGTAAEPEADLVSDESTPFFLSGVLRLPYSGAPSTLTQNTTESSQPTMREREGSESSDSDEVTTVVLPKRGKRKKRSDFEKDQQLKTKTLSGMLTYITDTLDGAIVTPPSSGAGGEWHDDFENSAARDGPRSMNFSTDTQDTTV